MINVFNTYAKNVNRENNAVVDNNAVERLANAWKGFAKLKVRFKTVAGKAQVRIMADFGNRREEIRTWADEALLEIVVNALNGKMNVEEYLSTEHPALIIEELETEMFKQDILSGRKLTFQQDFVTEETRYLHAVSRFYRGEIDYYVKRTGEIEQFLEENNLITKKLIG